MARALKFAKGTAATSGIRCGPVNELGLVPILERRLDEIRPAPENDSLYRPVDPADPEIRALARSIKAEGLLVPLVITWDDWIISGHRRYAACILAGLKVVPCRVELFRRVDDPDRFVHLLREYNLQRDKSFDEKLREETIAADPYEAYQALLEHRRHQSQVQVEPLVIEGRKTRARISAAKQPFLDAILAILEERRDFWPLSDRQIHYPLLNAPPPIHASRPKKLYSNTLASYKALVDLLVRARLDGTIPMTAIADATRPVELHCTHRDCRDFIRNELHWLFKGYRRDLMQSQPNHVEIVGEKNTVAPILKPIAEKYTIPLTTGRGYCSLPPRYEMAERFRKSGKSKLVLLIVSDFDPDGEEIAHSFARSMRDDFHIRNIHPLKVALSAGQVAEYRLPPMMQAKVSSSNHAKFTAKHGNNVFELEALPPRDLQGILARTIDAIIDIDMFNRELDAERSDAVELDRWRRRVHQALRSELEGG